MGGMNDGEYHVDPEMYEARLHYKRPIEREYFRWLKKLYSEGLLDKDSLVQKEDQYKVKIASGRVLGAASDEGQVLRNLGIKGKESITKWKTAHASSLPIFWIRK